MPPSSANRATGPTPIQRRLVELGMIGRKAGRGFYVYDGDKATGPNPLLAVDPTYATALMFARLPDSLERELASWLNAAGADDAISGPGTAGRLCDRAHRLRYY